ncbi:hypothetical protein K438DRAFT_1961664 [Mycena galopus ATCC 62051]|nr:hypothetical protein K438DRAFT_1961664 [Mycena galopus ATCC 62051]
MRFTISAPLLVLAAASSAVLADQCGAVCPNSLLPGVSEIVWHLVWNRTIADNVKFCAYHGTGRQKSQAQTFCMYNDNNGTIIYNEQSLQACPKTVKTVKTADCDD